MDSEQWAVAFAVRVRTHNRLNGTHGHWSTIAKARRTERTATAMAWYSAMGPGVRPVLPVLVTLTRLSPGSRPMDEPDGLSSALKSIRDEVARHLGVDDADPRITWKYAQERAKEHGVRVAIVARSPSNPQPHKP